MTYRVVYGETRPAWEKVFPTKRKADAFAKQQRKCGDTVFSVEKTVAGEPPKSLMAAIRLSNVKGYLTKADAKRRGATFVAKVNATYPPGMIDSWDVVTLSTGRFAPQVKLTDNLEDDMIARNVVIVW